MARDIAQRFNHLYGEAYRRATGGDADPFVLPEVVIEENVATLPGLDGRKMSKSYDNTIPLWLPRESLRKAILGVVTDSRRPGEPKDPDTSNLFALYRAFASDVETAAMRDAFAAGIAWGEAKQQVFERIDAELAEPRKRYEKLIAEPAAIERILSAGARKARERSAPLLAALREAVGLGALKPASQVAGAVGIAPGAAPAPVVTATFKSYREADGRFYFKLVRNDDTMLLQSRGFDAPKEAGSLVANLVDAGAVNDAIPAGDGTDHFVLRDAHGAEYADGFVPVAEVNAALAALREAKLARQKG
jgi:tryptophanyl-tRNA synthetase